MKKLLLIIIFAIMLQPAVYASDNYIAFLDCCGFLSQDDFTKEIKSTIKKHTKYSNFADFENLEAMYAPHYMNADGFNKDIYFDLVKQTWKLYPDIKYSSDIKNITVNGNTATVEALESASASTTELIEGVKITGNLKSSSSSIYYLEKINGEWKFVSDSIISELTTLTYGEAEDIGIELVVPQIVPADTEYTASLNISVPDREMLIISSIGQEKITYPQVNAKEVFRKLPDDGILERVFRSNKENLNEYTVASVGITRAKKLSDVEIKIYVTGLGYAITRTNVIPQKDFSKAKDEKEKSESVE
jgi:hypothetical protein